MRGATVHSIMNSHGRPWREIFHLVILFAFVEALSINASAQVASPEGLKKLSLEELMNVEVTSVSKRPEKLKEVASAIQVITQEDIRRSGATNVPEALRLASNLQVAQVNSSQWAISARGFNNVLSDKLLVLIDGRSVYTPLYAGVFWDVQNLLLEDIDRIEVISGPGGALWGANAVNGIINITTKNAKKTQGLFVDGGAGSALKSYGALRYGGKLGKNIYYRVYGMAYNRGSTINSDTSANDKWWLSQGGFRVDWDDTKKNSIRVQSNFYTGQPNPDGTTNVVANGTNIIGRWTHQLSDNSEYKLQAYYDQTWRDFRNGFTENLKIYDIDWQHRFQLGNRQEIIWGAGVRFMDDKEQNLQLFEFLPAQKTLHIYNTFIQDNITLVKERLHLTIGSKLEHNSYTGFQNQPSSRLTWTVTDRQTVWAAASSAVRTPSRIDRDFFLSLTPSVPLITGGSFVSEKLLSYELGWRVQLREGFLFSMATFYNFYDNLRSVEPSPTIYPVTYGNGVKGESYGVELSATQQLTDWWRLREGYTLLRKNLSLKPGSQDLNKGTAESNDPGYQALIQSMMDLPGKIELGAVLRYVDVLPQPHVAGYAGLDVRIGWKLIRSLEFNIVGQNLLSNRHAEFIPSSPSPRLIERSVYLKLTWRLIE